MSTYEKSEVTGLLRALARAELDKLNGTIARVVADLPLAERVELSAWAAEGRRLLHGNEAPAAPELPPNVHCLPMRRTVAAGKTGPMFGARGGVEFVVGMGGLHMRATDLLDLGATYDSTPKPTNGGSK